MQNAYQLDISTLEKFKHEVAIMHPLPRVDEISKDMDAYPGSLYFDQAHNGVVVRMALLSLLMG